MHRSALSVRPAALVLALSLLPGLAGAQTTWLVDAAAPPGGDGSPGAPFQTIQAAIAAAAPSAGDEVRVAPGTYVEHVDFLGKAVRVDRQGASGEVVIAAPGPGSVVTIGGPDHGHAQVLANVTVTGGDAALGGGLHVSGANPRIEGCVFRQNRASSRGAGVYVAGPSTCLLEGCRFEGNFGDPESGLQGGGLHATAGTVVRDCELVDNTAGSGGGAFGDARFEGCLFEGNRTYGNGGGAQDVVAVGCTFTGNEAGAPSVGIGGSGGGAYASELEDCAVLGNVAAGNGGGLLACVATGCSITGNQANGSPGSFGGEGGGASFCTLVGGVVDSNFAADGGGTHRGSASGTLYLPNFAADGDAAFDTDLSRCVIVGHGSFSAVVRDGSLEHCVLQDNDVSGGIALVAGASVRNSVVRSNAGPLFGAGVTVSWSNVEGGAAGTGNIDAPALFWSPDGGPSGEERDFHLMAGSPCIDAGDPASPLDPDGSRADMGAFPFDAGWFRAIAYCAAGTTTHGCEATLSWTGIPSATAGSGFELVASGVEGGASGLVFYGTSGADMLPWQGSSSFLCVVTPAQRMTPQSAGGTPGQCDGELREDWNLFVVTYPGAIGAPFAAGDTVWAQAWFRDPPSPAGHHLSDALQFTVGP